MEESTFQQPTFVGRREELNELKELLANAGQGQGSTIFISGEAGIGKTRLVSEFMGQAEKKEAKIIRGWCLPECLEPLMPVKEALRDVELHSLMTDAAPPRVLSSYLLNDAGLLYAKAEREETGMDADIFAAMLKAVSSFAVDSLEMMGQKGSGGLNAIGYSKYKILLQSRGKLSLAVVIEGNESELLIDDMKHLLMEIEPDIKSDIIDVSQCDWIRDKIFRLIGSGKYEGYFLIDDPRLKQENMFDNVLLGLQRLSLDKPLLFFMDDIQWADPSTLSLIHYLARNTRNNRIMLLATYRPEDIIQDSGGKPHALETTMQNMSRESLFQDFKLKRLGQEETGNIVKRLLGDTELPSDLLIRTFKESEGNPFFTLELVRLLAEEGHISKIDEKWKLTQNIDELMLPSKIFDVIQRRLNRLLKEQYEILECASVVGELFSSDIVGQSLGSNRIVLLKNLSDIEKVHMLIHSLGKKYSFDHSKIREVLYNSINEELQGEYHKIVAESYLSIFQGREDEIVEELAHHFSQAEDSRATEFLLKAGDKAKSRYANEEAIHFYSLALGMVDGDDIRCDLHEKVGELQMIVGNCELAIISFNKALELATQDIRKANIYRKISKTYERHSKYDEGIEAADKGLAILGDLADSARSELLGSMSWCYIRLGNYDKAMELQEISLENSKKIDDNKEIAMALHLMGTILWFRGRFDMALDYYQKAIIIQREIGDDRGKENTLNNIGVIYMEIGRLDEALEYFEEGLVYEEMIGDKNGMAGTIDNIGNICHTKGQVEKSLEHHLRSLELYRMVGNKNGIAWSLSSLGYVYPDMGDIPKGIQCHMDSVELCKEIGDKHILVYNYYGIAEANVKMKDYDTALKYVNMAMELAKELEATRETGASLYVLGMIQRDTKDYSEAHASFNKARKILEEVGDTTILAMIDYDQGLSHNMQGDGELARAMLEKANDTFKDLGMMLWVQRAEDALNALS